MKEAETRAEHFDPALDELKQSLLHEAFSGELTVTPDKAIAEARL